MAKSVNSLSGAAKDAYLQKTITAETELDAAARERLAERLQAEVTRVWVRTTAMTEPVVDTLPEASEPESATPGFDPFTPNVVVVVRTAGRDEALAALGEIAEIDHLKLLAREQQLGIEADLTGPDAIRLAIVAAAERRIANRRAAAS